MEANGETYAPESPDMALSSACKGESEAGPVGDSEVKLEPQPSSGPTRVASIAGMTPENFREVALTVLTKEMKAWQGPAQYLRATFKTAEAREKFRQDLNDSFESRPDLEYHRGPVLPDNTSTRFKLRLSDLGFLPETSTKSAPLLTTCLLLLDEFLTNSVLTEEDPLQLVQGPESCSTSPFWTHFVKGSARAATVLFLASQAMERKWNLGILCPSLQASLCALTARRAIMTTDAQSVALENGIG